MVVTQIFNDVKKNEYHLTNYIQAIKLSIIKSKIVMQQSSSLEQKQAYLRQNINVDLYEEFVEFCQNTVENIDINSWKMQEVYDIVLKFKKSQRQKALKVGHSVVKDTYNKYQSSDNKSDVYYNVSDSESCRSSRVVRGSAIQLLDDVLSSQSDSIKSDPKESNKKNGKNQTVENKQKNNSSSVSFAQFDFWTSTMSSDNTPKISAQIRNKSATQFKASKFQNNYSAANSPITQKNNNSYNYDSNQYNYSKPTSNLPKNEVVRNKSSTMTVGSDFQYFTIGTNEQLKKSSPYLKKETPNEPYQGTQKRSGIKLKQVREIQEIPKSSSINSNLPEVEQIPFDETLTCYKSLIRGQLADRNLNIYVGQHQIIERKFLAADYAMFNIKIAPLGIQCKRNYEDFAKLRDNLKKFFPGMHMPYLEQTSWLSGTNVDFISNQKKMLQFFARDLVRNKQFRNSRVLEDFLTLKDHKSIKRKFEKYDEMQPLKGLQQLCLLEGKVHVNISKEQHNYIQSLEKFIQRMNSLYERQERLTQTLIEQYNELMKTYKFLINLMEETERQIKQFNMKVTTNTIKYLGNSIRIVKQTYNQQFNNAKFDSEINSRKILPFIKYERKNFNQLNKLLESYKKIKKTFDKRSLIQKIGVGETYMSQTAKVTKKGILQQNQSLIVLKYQLGYIGHQARFEGQRIFDELAVKTLAKWQQHGESYLNKLSTGVSYWQEVTKLDRNKFNTDLTF